jgi:hypothetical protein
MARFSWFGWVLIVATVAVLVALAVSRATGVLIAAVVIASAWGSIVASRDPARRRIRGDDPAVSQAESWRDRDL